MNKVIKIVKTQIPNEFLTYGTISWKVIELKNRKFDIIIGQNVLRSLKAIINVECNYIEIKNNKIFFIDSEYPFCIHKINILEPIENKIFDNINLNHINYEEKEKLNGLLKRYKNLFYMKGDTLSFTHEIEHEIITNTDRPIYSKTCRYPKIH